MQTERATCHARVRDNIHSWAVAYTCAPLPHCGKPHAEKLQSLATLAMARSAADALFKRNPGPGSLVQHANQGVRGLIGAAKGTTCHVRNMIELR